MYTYQDYMKNLIGPIAESKRQNSRKSSSAKSDKDQNEKQGDQDAST